ncbi:[Fe-Fe] hydrogenase large subunit C-terminal domain-containing protein [Thermoanaerobacterium thermosaccharolyticum]|uniref:PAS/PAC sensor protein n=3 Tax=Thermoanaerobacterium thermosaccharolyticum TaxID=1517 RepID=A0A223I234_THETR|nr:[Fe-Fe] hydrogenase large subunit C-terminal domain-containing protein [Thermoanaerobacterium thermosaccharolyticum]ADL69281.1 putative PAS/PAC sensor protein [Thermoanaerobacterium thermosaccharolyticum DSM 571]AGB19411.1 iron only hydrogenase large subunit [Thermoanaerobacterium thermosaccharolyticum M0795]AST58707.1 PAS/PAC sensor protein [Thermoanaerobacterium thermosaccharolyticum]MCP2239877.1 iron only hydrogenase large subunit-like protein [Thermoanaerobacterium thermosaccharolyticum]
MSVINFKEANCRNCYKCIRYCPVKAIKVNNEQAEIVDYMCIACGRCLNVCPQNAKTVRSDIEKVKAFIKKGDKVVFTIAPSYPALVGSGRAFKFLNALKSLGAEMIIETSVGAMFISKEYERYYNDLKYDNLITTSCPSINYLIEKYYPDLINCLVPVVSPMIAVGRVVKKVYGNEIKVVFIGPCLAKKVEMNDFSCEDAIDAVLTFEEIIEWLDGDGINIDSREEFTDCVDTMMPFKLYPIEGKTIDCMDVDLNLRKVVSVSSIDNVKDLLNDIRSGNLHGYWIEANACDGGCINGPAFGRSNSGVVKRKEEVINYSNTKANFINDISNMIDCSVDFTRKFINLSDKWKMPSENEIKNILSKIGKFTKEDELNCGACGYDTCREKAIAVFNGMAEPYMCLPYMRGRAETLSNIIISSTPNAIIAVNNEYEIQDMNRAFEKMFLVNSTMVKNENLSLIFDISDFKDVIENKKSIFNKKVSFKNYGIIALESIYYLEEYKIAIGIFTDITKMEKQKEAFSKVKRENYQLAQQVIDRQMKVAQEIASLLGETTAETKVILTRMKDMLLNQGDDE